MAREDDITGQIARLIERAERAIARLEQLVSISASSQSCAHCRGPMQAHRRGKKFCSEACRYKAWQARQHPHSASGVSP